MTVEITRMSFISILSPHVVLTFTRGSNANQGDRMWHTVLPASCHEAIFNTVLFRPHYCAPSSCPQCWGAYIERCGLRHRQGLSYKVTKCGTSLRPCVEHPVPFLWFQLPSTARHDCSVPPTTFPSRSCRRCALAQRWILQEQLQSSGVGRDSAFVTRSSALRSKPCLAGCGRAKLYLQLDVRHF